MNYTETLKRAFKITIKYRALWLFGFFLALCGGGGGGSGGGTGSGGPSSSGSGSDFSWGNGNPPFDFNTPAVGTIIAIVAGIVLLVFVLVAIGIIVRSVTRTSLIGMVNQIEDTGAVTIKEGWRIGWSRKAWRIFLINLVIGIPMFIIVIASLLLVASPIALGLINKSLFILGGIIAVGLFLLWILLALAVGVILSAFTELAWRYTVLGGRGVIDSLKASYHLIRNNLKDVGITVLILIGLGMAWGIVTLVLVIVVMIVALVVGGIPGVIGYALTQEIVVALLAGVPLFLVTLILPLTFVTGLYLIFRSAVWTLLFRQLEPAVELSGLNPLPATSSAVDEASAPFDPDLATNNDDFIIDPADDDVDTK